MYPEQTVSEHVFITPHRQRYQPASVTVCALLDKTERTGVFWLNEDKKKNKYSSEDADSVLFCRGREQGQSSRLVLALLQVASVYTHSCNWL